MAIQWTAGDTFTCVSSDSKPTNVPIETRAIETNTDDIYRYNGSAWVLLIGNDKTETLTNKTIGNQLDMDRVTAPANPGSNQGRFYVKQVDANNDGVFCKIKKAGAFVEVQIL